MATFTMTVRPYEYPDAKQDHPDEVACLSTNDVLAVTTADFVSDCRLDAIKFYVKEADETANKHFAAWTYGFGPQHIVHVNNGKTTNLFYVVWQSNTQVNIKNTADVGAAEQHVWFKVEVLNTKTHERWVLDPEVINTGGGDNRLGFVTPGDGDGGQTLGA
jgi:hypothetical protein